MLGSPRPPTGGWCSRRWSSETDIRAASWAATAVRAWGRGWCAPSSRGSTGTRGPSTWSTSRSCGTGSRCTSTRRWPTSADRPCAGDRAEYHQEDLGTAWHTPSEEEQMTDVVDLIVQDHRELQRLFAELRSEPAKRPTLAPVMSTLLFAHSRAEESEVYPRARAAGGQDDVEHSQEEHLAADRLAERLTSLDPESDEFAQVLEELVEAVTHHLEEEEESVLPHMRERLTADELDDLGERFLAARAER